MNPNSQQRRGFTLIELLVVMSLIAILAALAVAFIPSAASSAKEARAGTQVQGYLTIAKQRAMRDQIPSGLRLLINPSVIIGGTPLSGAVTDCQYIQQPEDFPSNASVGMVCPPPFPLAPAFTPLACVYMNTDLTNGYPPTTGGSTDPNVAYWAVQPGDYLEVQGTGLVRQIVQIGVLDATNTLQPQVIVVTPALPGPVGPTANFRIIRAPRVSGDDPLTLPDGTIIDFQTNNGGAFTPANPLPITNGYVDILFAPSGEVIYPQSASSNIHLWVRTPNPAFPTDPFRGDPTIISVFTKTGFVGAFPPLPGAAPYSLVR